VRLRIANGRRKGRRLLQRLDPRRQVVQLDTLAAELQHHARRRHLGRRPAAGVLHHLDERGDRDRCELLRQPDRLAERLAAGGVHRGAERRLGQPPPQRPLADACHLRRPRDRRLGQKRLQPPLLPGVQAGRAEVVPVRRLAGNVRFWPVGRPLGRRGRRLVAALAH
jgi:hypothetical protein